MPFKFEKLEVWKLSIDLSDDIYNLIKELPESEKFNLCSQVRRTVTSISLNIAEGSTGLTNPEQARFISYAHRSLMEVVACLILMQKRSYIKSNFFNNLYNKAEVLSVKLLAFRNYLTNKNQVNETEEDYNF
jgi:four helix bundle protein